jgi:AraC family transcriptional regulator
VTRSADATIRKAKLAGQPEFDAYLVYYPAGLEQRPHEHDCSQFSFLLAGSLIERVEGQEHRAGPGQASAKPQRVAHANSYGPNGAVLMSFHFRCEGTAEEVIRNGDWHWRLASATPEFGALGDVDGLWDVLGAAERRAPAGTPPEWLRWARSELDRGDRLAGIASLAAEAGVHRVHFSRQFAQHYGIAASIYRQRQMAARAIRAMIDDRASPAAAAHDSGFVDQSHLSRAIHATFGTTPRRLAALLNS